MHGSPDARALHAAYPAVDLHADTLMWTRWIGYDLSARHDALLPRSALFGHVDLPRLAEGGIGLAFLGRGNRGGSSVGQSQLHGMAQSERLSRQRRSPRHGPQQDQDSEVLS